MSVEDEAILESVRERHTDLLLALLLEASPEFGYWFFSQIGEAEMQVYAGCACNIVELKGRESSHPDPPPLPSHGIARSPG